MTELLLITDIPRLRKIFSRISDKPDMRLRVSTSLENGAMEIIAQKPAIVFVQTHLSGFSPDILLMHLKRQLGRKRSRFILLSSKDQVNEEVLKQYQGHIDTTLDDNLLLEAIHGIIEIDRKNTKNESTLQTLLNEEHQNASSKTTDNHQEFIPLQNDPAFSGDQIQKTPSPENVTAEASLEEQGVIYSGRNSLSVYSEFTSSFDSAVSSMPSNETEQKTGHWSDMPSDDIEFEPARTRPKWVKLLFWALPLLTVVIAFTLLQQHFSQPKPVDIAPTVPVPSQNNQSLSVPAAPAEKIIADQQIVIPNPTKKATPNRLTKLPDFIPANKRDSKYSKSNPGWELYKGIKTDFKVYREDKTIKAIQIIDREGKGLSELFMSNILKQLVKNPDFVQESSEKKDGYEIRRGRLTDDLTMVHYRDVDSSKLRAFVITWR